MVKIAGNCGHRAPTIFGLVRAELRMHDASEQLRRYQTVSHSGVRTLGNDTYTIAPLQLHDSRRSG